MTDSMLSTLFGEILEAARASDELTRQANTGSGAFMEYALLPDKLELVVPVSIGKDAKLDLGGEPNGELRIRFRRLQTPESVRAEIDDVNEIDGLIRDHHRNDRRDERNGTYEERSEGNDDE